MADNLSREKRSKVMASIHGKDTKPELILWEQFDHRRIRRYPPVAGRPDFGNISRKVAIFVDGCFWHGCPVCYKTPATRVEYWSNKLKRNIEHDAKVNKLLCDSGFKVIRLWEHEVLGDLPSCVSKVYEVLD